MQQLLLTQDKITSLEDLFNFTDMVEYTGFNYQFLSEHYFPHKTLIVFILRSVLNIKPWTITIRIMSQGRGVGVAR